MNRDVAFKSLKPFYVNTINSSYPTKYSCTTNEYDMDDDDITVPTSNVADKCWTIKSYHTGIAHQEFAGGVFLLLMKHAIANLGATQNFVMDGTPVNNKQPTTQPLRVALVDGCQVMSTHMCNIQINGLPVTLTGHIIPNLSIALLFGI